MIKVKQCDVGRFVRVLYDDVGAEDGLLVSVDAGCIQYLSLRGGLTDNNGAPVIALGKRFNTRDTGLDK